MLEKFDIWGKLQTFNIVKTAHPELPLCHVANHISFPSPINIHLVLYHKLCVVIWNILKASYYFKPPSIYRCGVILFLFDIIFYLS